MRLPDSVALPLPPATVDDARADPLRAPTLIAFILAGLALVAAQFPYGRFGTVGLAGVGLLIAGACWFGAHRPLLPAAATIVNAIVVIVALVLPNWIGLGAWRSGKPDWAPATGSGVKAFGPNGLESPGGEWIRGDYGWQLDDVRVRLPLLAVGPVELTGSQKRRSTRDYLQVQVRVQNVGVARTIAFNGWNVGPLAGNAAPRLVDSAGHVLPLATVEPGLEGLVRPTQAALASGRAADQLLLFEPPAGTFDYVRLELPGSAFGWTQAVRFQIAPSQIVKRSP